MPYGRMAPKLSVKSYFAAVQTVDANDHGHRAFGIFRQSQVSNNFRAFEMEYATVLKRRIPESCMGQNASIAFAYDSFFFGDEGIGQRPNEINAPSPNEIGIGFGGIRFLQRLPSAM